MSSASPNRLKPLDGLVPGEALTDSVTKDTAPDGISDEEALAIRSEKLEAIKKAIQGGVYDSDELLEEAMSRLMNAVENDDS